MNEDRTKKSILVPVVKFVIKVAGKPSIHNILVKLIWPKKSHGEIPFRFVEIYVVSSLLLMSLGLACVEPISSIHFALVCFVIYRLFDLLVGTADIVFNEREDPDNVDEFGHYIHVRDVTRWVTLVLLNMLEIVVGFAIIYLYIGTEFSEEISNAVTALYQSALTFTTLGYGEIRPIPESDVAKIVVTLQLFYFVFFLLFKAPIIFSAVRAREFKK